MTEAKKDDKPINETIYIPKQQAHQLGGFSSRTQGVLTLKIGLHVKIPENFLEILDFFVSRL